MKAAVPKNEPERLAALDRYDILDTPREPEFDEIVELAAQLCQAPIAVINLITSERQWFKAEVGLGARQTRSAPHHARATPPAVVRCAAHLPGFAQYRR